MSRTKAPKNFRKTKLIDVLRAEGVNRIGELTRAERGEAEAGTKTRPVVPYAVVDGAARAGIAPQALVGLAKKSKAWKLNARWDVPLLGAVAWKVTLDHSRGINTGGLVYLGTAREIVRAIRGCDPRDITNAQVHQVEESLERLTSLRLDDIGWVEEGGPPGLAKGQIMSLSARTKGGEWVVQAGACIMPLQVMTLIENVGEHHKRNSAAMQQYREMVQILVPVQSRGLLLDGYLPGDSTRAAQDRAYAMLHAVVIEQWAKKPNYGQGLRLKRRWWNEKVQDFAKMSYDRWKDFVDLLERLGHYEQIDEGLYIPSDPRAQHWLEGRKYGTKAIGYAQLPDNWQDLMNKAMPLKTMWTADGRQISVPISEEEYYEALGEASETDPD